MKLGILIVAAGGIHLALRVHDAPEIRAAGKGPAPVED